jgi:hypothetical protein
MVRSAGRRQRSDLIDHSFVVYVGNQGDPAPGRQQKRVDFFGFWPVKPDCPKWRGEKFHGDRGKADKN